MSLSQKHGQTPSQTVGPYFAYGLTSDQYGYAALKAVAGPDLLEGDTPGERITIVGRVLDGAGAPVDDALIEIWQADAEGRYTHPADARGANAPFRGFGRCGTGTDPERRFSFRTIRPGAPGDGQAPHISVIVFMRGLLTHTYTRLYFSDLEAENAADPVLQSVPGDRRDTLIAERMDGPDGTVYHFDIHMQGDRETVFFDV